MKNILFYSSLILTCSTFAQVNLSSSLTACYSFNGNTNDPINNFTGTLSALTATVDRFNNPSSAYYFNGSSYVILPDDPLLKPSDAVSFSLWVKPSNTQGAHIIYTRNNLSSNFEAFQLAQYNASPVFRLNKSSANGNDIALSTTTINPGTWYHIVGTLDDFNVKIYVNGVLEGSTQSSFTGFDYMVGKNVMLGATNEFFDLPFDGSMDNVRFYNRTLTQAEVTALYNQDPICVTSTGLPPVASFTTSSVHACLGDSITFYDSSTNSPTAWAWQLLGPSPSNFTLNNVTHSFISPGTYTMVLSSSNSFGVSSNTATQSIVISPSPTLQAIANPTTICSPGGIAMLTISGANTYSWSNGQTSASYTISPSITTNYTVTGTNDLGCSNTATVSVFVSNCTGISKNENNFLKISVSPNPSGGNFVISANEELHAQLKVTDIAGRIVITKSIELGSNPNFDLRQQPSGIYFVSILTINSAVCLKVIKE